MFERFHEGIFWDEHWEVIAPRGGINGEVLWTPFNEKVGRVYLLSGDPFHPGVTPEELDRVLSIVASSPQHLFIAVTKRPELAFGKLYGATEELPYRLLEEDDSLKNLWFLIYVCDQEEADLRLPAAIALKNCWVADGVQWPVVGVLAEPLRSALDIRAVNSLCLAGFGCIDWIVCGRGGEDDAGDESLEWARDLRDQAEERGVPFLFTGLGDGAGRLLDGRTWDEVPCFTGERSALHIFDHCRVECRIESSRLPSRRSAVNMDRRPSTERTEPCHRMPQLESRMP